MKLVWFAGLILLFAFLAGCSGFAKDAPTHYPTEYLPTMIALTVEANRLAMLTPVPSVDGTAASLNATPTSSLSLEKRTALHTPQPSVVRTDAILPTPSASRTKTTRPSMTITKTL